MKILDYVLITKSRRCLEDAKSISTISSETKTLWRCVDGTRIYKDKKYNDNGKDSLCLYQGNWGDYATVITKEQKEEFEHKNYVNRKFNDTCSDLKILEHNNSLLIKNKEDISNMVNEYLKNNVYAKKVK